MAGRSARHRHAACGLALNRHLPRKGTRPRERAFRSPCFPLNRGFASRLHPHRRAVSQHGTFRLPRRPGQQACNVPSKRDDTGNPGPKRPRRRSLGSSHCEPSGMAAGLPACVHNELLRNSFAGIQGLTRAYWIQCENFNTTDPVGPTTDRTSLIIADL